MGEPTLANWRTSGRLLRVSDVMSISGFSYSTILGLVKAGKLRPALNKKPFKFDPDQVHALFFEAHKADQVPESQAKPALRSLKIEAKSISVGRSKPAERGDLWD